MRMKKILIIILIIVIAIALILGIVKLVDNFRKNYESPINIEYDYYKLYSNDKFGVINTKGEKIIDSVYDDIIIPNPSENVFICTFNYNAATEEYDYKVLNEKGEEIFTSYEEIEVIPVTGIIGGIPYEKWALKYKQDNKYGLIDLNGKKLTKPIYEEIESVPYKEGVFLVKKDGKYGVINNKGVTIIKPEYDSILGDGYYNDEIGYKASGYIVKTVTENGEYYGYIDSNGETLLTTEYDEVYRIREATNEEKTYIIASKNGQYGLMEKTQILISFNYQELSYDEEASLVIAKRNKNYGVLNMEGNKVLPFEFSNIDIEGLYIIATKDDATEKYTLSGETITQDNYLRIEKTTNDNYFISIDKNYSYGLLDKENKIVIENEYEYLEHAFENYFIARNDSGKYGIINTDKQEVVEFKYDVVQNLKNTQVIQAMILQSNDTYLYNKDMKQIFKGSNANIYTYENYLKVDSDGEIKYFDNQGNATNNSIVYPNNKLLSYIEEGKWGFKDKSGNIVVKANYDKVTEFNKYGFAGVKLDEKWGVIDETGNVVIEPTYIISDTVGEPEFIGKYYRTYYGYMEAYYTDNTGENQE